MKLWALVSLGAGASLAALAGARAADLPTTKGAPPAPPAKVASCTGFQDFLTTACPLTYGGVTLYGTIDMGVGYDKFGAPWNPTWNVGSAFILSKAGRPNLYTLAPNGLSQSNVGIKGKFDIENGWSIVGQAETGFDPYSLQLANGPGSLYENNLVPLSKQTASGDSSRAGQSLDSQYFAGVSNATFGTLTFGRVNTLLLDGVNAYDPMGGSYAFSVIGNAGMTAGGGNTENTRSNEGFKYRVTYGNFRAAALVQVGGYAQGNASSGMYQGQVGFDYAGFSFDAIGSYIQDSDKQSTVSAPITPPAPDALNATISNDTSVMLLGKYVWNQLTLFSGFEAIAYKDPTSQWATPGNFFTGLGGNEAKNGGDKFFSPEYFQVYWTGAKYAFTPDLVGVVAYYHYNQDFYMATSTSKRCSNSSASYCAGTFDAISAMLDYRFGFAQKFDVYGGAMWSQVSNGLANGYQTGGHVNIDPTVGLRFRF
jgi:predicted porin